MQCSKKTESPAHSVLEFPVMRAHVTPTSLNIMKTTPSTRQAFTLVELLTVIAIIAVLMGLLFPTVGAVRDSARRAQAQNDVTQIATAIRAFYTEYGRYPDVVANEDNAGLIQILTGQDATKNRRKIVFFEGTVAKEAGRYGIQNNGAGAFLDPWGGMYKVEMDTDYNNEVSVTGIPGYTGPTTIRTGVAVWSEGKPESTPSARRPIVSWQ